MALHLSLQLLVSSLAVGTCYQKLSFDGATASSTYAVGSNPFEHAALHATTQSAGYWCSTASQAAGQVVTWTGFLDAQRSVSGITLSWAYSPGELKILVSTDGANFFEQQSWHRPARAEMAYEHTLMFSDPVDVRAVTLFMRTPQSWAYFGLNQVLLLAEPGPVMIVSGASTSAGDLCLVLAGRSVHERAAPIALKPCLSAIAAGDGADVFKFTPRDNVVHDGSKLCLTSANMNS